MEMHYKLNNSDRGRLLCELYFAEKTVSGESSQRVRWAGGKGNIEYQIGDAVVNCSSNNLKVCADTLEQVDKARTRLETLIGIKLTQNKDG